jgi:hypothetical protein
MLKRDNWRALQGLGATPAKPIQLEFAFLLPSRLDLVPPLQIKRREFTQRKKNDDGQN